MPQSFHRQVSLMVRFIATGAFTGYTPLAPGTIASLLAVAFYAIPGAENPLLSGLLIVILFFIGVATASSMERSFGTDPAIVVIDEFVGMWVSLWMLPKELIVTILAFFLFRLLDIVKPFPARRAEQLPGGWGVMMDDVISGIYANVIVRAAIFITHW